MSALRKAGVWLGLVEEDDERGYDDRGYRDSGYRERDRDRDSGYRYADEFADEDDDVEEAPALPRARTSDRVRLAERASSRAAADWTATTTTAASAPSGPASAPSPGRPRAATPRVR